MWKKYSKLLVIKDNIETLMSYLSNCLNDLPKGAWTSWWWYLYMVRRTLSNRQLQPNVQLSEEIRPLYPFSSGTVRLCRTSFWVHISRIFNNLTFASALRAHGSLITWFHIRGCALSWCPFISDVDPDPVGFAFIWVRDPDPGV